MSVWTGRTCRDVQVIQCSTISSHFDELAIFGNFTENLPKPGEHIRAHVSYDQSFRLKLVEVGHQGLIIQVKLDFLLEEVRLCNQEVGSLSRKQKCLRPFRIPRIGDNFSCTLDAQSQRTHLRFLKISPGWFSLWAHLFLLSLKTLSRFSLYRLRLRSNPFPKSWATQRINDTINFS